MKRLNNREIEVLGILAAADQPQTSTQIINAGEELTQSTVQAVLRKLMEAGHIAVQGVTHSGNVLSRTFAVAEAGRAAVLEDFLEHYRRIGAAINVQEAVEALQRLGEKQDETVDAV